MSAFPLDDPRFRSTLEPLTPLTPRAIEEASQDAAWRILAASDALTQKMAAFEARQGREQAADQARLERIEQAIRALGEAKPDLGNAAQLVKESFDGVATELDRLTVHVLGQVRPEPRGEDSVLAGFAETMVMMAEGARTDRQTLRDLVTRLDAARGAEPSPASLEAPLRAIAADLKRIERRLDEIETDHRQLPGLPVPQPPPGVTVIKVMEHERSALQRMIVGFGMLMQQVGDLSERFEAALSRFETPASAPGGTEAVDRLGPQLAAIQARLDEIADRRVAMLPSHELAFEKSQLQSLLLGFQLVAEDLARQTARPEPANPDPAADLAAHAAIAEQFGNAL
jgi:hypothetical protein